MRWILVTLLGSFVVTLVATGCGGGSGDGSASCSTTFTPCGGDLTGTWTYQTDCNPSMMITGCPGATEDVTVNASGTFTFNADKTYTSKLTVDESGTASIPVSCTGSTTCSAADSDTTTGTFAIKNACTGTTTCACTATISGSVSTTGTYTTAGNDFTATPKGGTASVPVAYCVKGSQLEVAGGVFGNGTGNTYSLLTK